MPAARKSRSIIVKRYARSRLYDTASRRYVSVEQLRGWAAEGVAVAVIDAETGEDITSVLLA
jgi:polyhydroxyalkanoate synthesis regulator protein